MRLFVAATFAALLCGTAISSAAERIGGGGGSGRDFAVVGSFSANLAARLVLHTLAIARDDTNSNVGYDARLAFSNANSYFNIGWGHRGNSTAGLNFFADMGLIAGRPVFTLTPSSGLAPVDSPSYVAAEHQAAQNRANGLRNYPAIKLGIKYTF
jgi:hypothetical protein